jgi:hypothetical protein
MFKESQPELINRLKSQRNELLWFLSHICELSNGGLHGPVKPEEVLVVIKDQGQKLLDEIREDL